MRLPWLQVEQDGIAQCKRLARLLGVPDAHGKVMLLQPQREVPKGGRMY